MKQLRFRRVKEFYSNKNIVVIKFVSKTVARNAASQVLKDTNLDVAVYDNVINIIIRDITYFVTVNEFGYFVEID